MSHAPAHHHAIHTEEEQGPRKSWALLGIALAAQILVVLDISVVNTALPTIGSSLHLDGTDLQWLVTAYVMMSGGGLLLGGRISDLLSRRGVFLTGLALFTVASLVSGFADSGAQLIAARAVQGLSAALLTPSALALITTTYAGSQRKAALALWGVVGSLGVAAGVLVGGAITTWTSWQYIFWINVPVGLVALVVGQRVIAKESVTRPKVVDFDIPGAVTVIAGLATMVYALGGTATHGWWSVRTMTGLVASAVLLVVFLKLEQRAAKPLFPPHVWMLRSLVSGTAVMLGVTGILVGAVFLTSIFLQTVLGYSALRTGVAFLPFALAITAGTVVGSAPAGPPLSASDRGDRARDRRRRRCSAVDRHQRLALRLGPAAGSGRVGTGRGHGVRAGLGDLDDGDPGLARRRGVRLPDDRPRGRRCVGCRRPVRGRQHGGFPDQSDRSG